jgi:periplasmic protein CpxP/Spy
MKGHGKDHSKEMGEKGKAQGEQGKGQMGGNLGLSAEQETAFKAVNKAHQEAVKAVQMNKTLAADAKKAQVDALKSKYEADVKGTMNADQYTKWMAMRAKRSENKAEHKADMGDHKMEEHKDKAMKGKAKSDKAAQPQGAAKSH